VRDATERWLPRRTWTRPTWTAAELTAARAGRTVSVVLPALDEEETVGGVVAAVRPLLGTLVDEIVVVDSGSTDATAARARAAGDRVVPRDEVLPEVPVRAGKGEVLWRSLAATSGDLVVFLDSDLVDLGPDFVVNLLGPLLTVEGVAPPRPASCSSRCPSPRATASRSACSSTPTPRAGSTRSPRSTSACASTATAACGPWAPRPPRCSTPCCGAASPGTRGRTR
jgi:cellulose synthase/poly-beta-1,6-N-acetylglucosamine synthase-like glycosyltransferase